MYVYLLGLAVSNLCALITAVPALFDISSGLGGGNYTTAFYQVTVDILSIDFVTLSGRRTLRCP